MARPLQRWNRPSQRHRPHDQPNRRYGSQKRQRTTQHRLKNVSVKQNRTKPVLLSKSFIDAQKRQISMGVHPGAFRRPKLNKLLSLIPLLSSYSSTQASSLSHLFPQSTSNLTALSFNPRKMLSYAPQRAFASSSDQHPSRWAPIPASDPNLDKAQIDATLRAVGIDLDMFTSDPSSVSPSSSPSLSSHRLPSYPGQATLSDDDEDSCETDAEQVHRFTNVDQQNILPEYFDRSTHPIEWTIATLLQAEPDETPMFPTYLRRPIFERAMRTIFKLRKQFGKAHISSDVITGVLIDIFTQYAPELCRTHEHVLNILYPLSPRIGDIVELPSIKGKCLLEKRQYVDNRFQDDLAEHEKERLMILTYRCLDPSLHGKRMVTQHPFDVEVYRLTVENNEQGLERLMHERGMIDMITGRIIDPDKPALEQFKRDISQHNRLAMTSGSHLLNGDQQQHQQQQQQQQQQRHSIGHQLSGGPLWSDKPPPLPKELANHTMTEPAQYIQAKPSSAHPSLTGHSAHALVPTPQTSFLDVNTGTRLHNERQTLSVSSPTGSLTSQQRNILSELMSRDIQLGIDYLSEIRASQHRENKEYLKPSLILTGHAAMIAYKTLISNLSTGQNGINNNVTDFQHAVQQQIKQDAEIRARNIRNGIGNDGNINNVMPSVSSTRMSLAGAEYDISAWNTTGSSLGPLGQSTHTMAPVPNTAIDIATEAKYRREIDQSLVSTSHASKGVSKLAEKWAEHRSHVAAEVEEIEKSHKATTFLEQESAREAVHQQKVDHLALLQRTFDNKYKQYLESGMTQEEAQERADADLEALYGPANESMPSTTTTDEQTIKNNTSNESKGNELQEALENYKSLPLVYKAKYKHCIIKSGPGAGLPDPLKIDRNEDILAIYPKANVALIDFISDQWLLMIAQRQNKIKARQAQQDNNKLQQYDNNNNNNTNLNNDDAADVAVDDFDDPDYTMPRDPDLIRFRLMATVASAGDVAFSADYIKDLFERLVSQGAAEVQASSSLSSLSSSSLDNADNANTYDKLSNNTNINHTPTSTSSSSSSSLPFDHTTDPSIVSRHMAQLRQSQSYHTHPHTHTQQSQSVDTTTTSIAPTTTDLLSNFDESKAYDDYIAQLKELSNRNIDDDDMSGPIATKEGYVKYKGQLYTANEYIEMIFGQAPTPLEESHLLPDNMRAMLKQHAQEKQTRGNKPKKSSSSSSSSSPRHNNNNNNKQSLPRSRRYHTISAPPQPPPSSIPHLSSPLTSLSTKNSVSLYLHHNYCTTSSLSSSYRHHYEY